ncbi:MAG TPA: hypothetical protein VI544_02265 [Candidatus Nanoarchaeia archaeon]|nr:hypothetical protein [Candidatus Nanoarchaeia archaeon]
MKRAIYSVLLLAMIICSLGLVSAISTNLEDSYNPGETMITEISGNILEPITNANVELRRGHILVPFDYEVKKLGDKYYLWMTSPTQQINYTLRIKEITTYVSGNIREIDYEKNFSVSGNLSDYSIKPGVILAEKDFEIMVRLNEDNEKPITLKFIEETTFVLKPGENTLKFSIPEINESALFNVSVGKYSVPTYVISNKTEATTLNGTNASKIIDLTNLTDVEPETKEEEDAVNKERLKYHCYEFPGKICGANQVCSGETIVSLDGSCCVNGDCAAEDSGVSSSAWIGYLIAAIVVIAGVFIWIRYKKVKKDENPLAKRIHSLDKRIP